MNYEYKCVGGPERSKRQRGVRGHAERAALAMQEIISAEAVDGWEYLRTDQITIGEKEGFFSRLRQAQRTVLIFRREIEPEPRLIPAGRPLAASAEPPPWRSAEAAGEGQREQRIPLAAERDDPVPARREDRRPPSGLG